MEMTHLIRWADALSPWVKTEQWHTLKFAFRQTKYFFVWFLWNIAAVYCKGMIVMDVF